MSITITNDMRLKVKSLVSPGVWELIDYPVLDNASGGGTVTSVSALNPSFDMGSYGYRDDDTVVISGEHETGDRVVYESLLTFLCSEDIERDCANLDVKGLSDMFGACDYYIRVD